MSYCSYPSQLHLAPEFHRIVQDESVGISRRQGHTLESRRTRSAHAQLNDHETEVFPIVFVQSSVSDLSSDVWRKTAGVVDEKGKMKSASTII